MLQRHQNNSSTSDNKSSDGTCPARRVVRLKSVSVLEFEALLTFFYERYVGNIQAPTFLSRKEDFSMPILNWVGGAPLHRLSIQVYRRRIPRATRGIPAQSSGPREANFPCGATFGSNKLHRARTRRPRAAP